VYAVAYAVAYAGISGDDVRRVLGGEEKKKEKKEKI